MFIEHLLWPDAVSSENSEVGKAGMIFPSVHLGGW